MKLPSISAIHLAAALLWATAASAGLLTPWYPSDVLPIQGEACESVTNVCPVAAFGRANLVRRNGDAPREGEASLQASDGPANYEGQDSWPNGTGGEGWSGAWTAYQGAGNLEAACKVEAPSMALETKSEMGEVIVGRELAFPLANGEMSVHSWNDFGVDFLGFAVYGTRNGQAAGELLRWGLGSETVTSGYPGVGYVWSTDGGQSYSLLSDEASSGFTDYSLTWSKVTGGLSFTLSAFDQSAAAMFDPASLTVAASSVSAIAVVATGDKRIAFDNLAVSGNNTSIPEPGTLSLLLLGAALLAARRRSR